MIDERTALVEPRSRRRDLDDLAVPREDRTARLAQERRDVRREEVLPLAEADHERRLVADADEQIRLVVVDRDDREVPRELQVDAVQPLREVPVVLVLEP